eukprot:6919372-Prymnesium_polylepis.1
MDKAVVPLTNDKGGEVGELICSVDAVPALKALSAEAAAAGRIAVHVTKVEISAPDVRDRLRARRGATELSVLVDMLEVHEDASPRAQVCARPCARRDAV